MKKQWTTVSDFILHGKVSSKYAIIEVEGINQVGDGGALTLVRTGNVGTPNQSFTDTGNNTCVDDNGDVWEVQKGTILNYNGTDNWFGGSFGSDGVGTYILNESNVWVVFIDKQDIPDKSSFTLRFDSIANMLAGIPVRSEIDDVCIVLDTTFKHVSGSGFSITDFKPLSYRGGEAYEKTTIESLRNELSEIVDSPLLQYGSRKLVNNPDFTDAIEDIANFAGQEQGSSAPTGWIHHHYTDGIMHQWDNVGDGTMLYLKNAQNPGRRPDKASDYVGQGKFLSLGTEGFVGAGSERFFISPEVEFVYKRRQVAKFLSDLDPSDNDGFAFITSCYRAMELVQKWSSNGNDLMYIRRAPNGQPQFRLFSSGAFGTDGLILDLNTANDGTVRILTGPTSSNIDAGAGDLNLRPSSDDGAGVYANGVLKLKKYTTLDLPTLGGNDRAIAWDITQDYPVKWDGTSWVAV